jgi:thiamine pyrophosphate-dependent acetolactate synthase large subunit-like protein
LPPWGPRLMAIISPTPSSPPRCPAASISARSWSGCATTSPTTPSCATAPSSSPAPVIAIIADNGRYGTIRMHREREYPGRVSPTVLRNPDFAAYAKAFGGFGVKVEKTADFADAFRAAEQSGLPAIIHLKVDPDATTPATTLTKIREAALARQH